MDALRNNSHEVLTLSLLHYPTRDLAARKVEACRAGSVKAQHPMEGLLAIIR